PSEYSTERCCRARHAVKARASLQTQRLREPDPPVVHRPLLSVSGLLGCSHRADVHGGQRLADSARRILSHRHTPCVEPTRTSRPIGPRAGARPKGASVMRQFSLRARSATLWATALLGVACN